MCSLIHICIRRQQFKDYSIQIGSEVPDQGRIQDFKLGGGAHLKKWRRAEGGANIFGVFRVKNHDFTQKKIIFFPILGGGPLLPPGSSPADINYFLTLIKHYFCSQFCNYMYTCYLEIIKWTKILGQENKQDWIHL